VGDIK